MVGVGSSGGSGDFCCAAECGTCGGLGCTDFGDYCCTSDITASCSDTMEAPCVIMDDGDDGGGELMLVLLLTFLVVVIRHIYINIFVYRQRSTYIYSYIHI